MKHSEHDRLLKEIITGDELADFREASLQRALDAIRQRRHRRRSMQLGALAVLVLVAVGIIFTRSVTPPIPEIALSSSSPAAPSIPQTGPAEVKLINDEELLALFPDRPVALIGKPGQQRLVFLDKPARSNGGHL